MKETDQAYLEGKIFVLEELAAKVISLKEADLEHKTSWGQLEQLEHFIYQRLKKLKDALTQTLD